MNTKIVVDSSASLYTLQGVDFECVPLKIITDDAEYLDNGTMDALGMAQTLRTYKGKTSTSCPNVSDWLAAYEGADEVYAITITGTLSGSYNAAQLAVLELKEHGYTNGRLHISHCGNPAAAERLKHMVKAVFDGAKVDISECGGLCSYYAELGGLLVGYEDAEA